MTRKAKRRETTATATAPTPTTTPIKAGTEVTDIEAQARAILASLDPAMIEALVSGSVKPVDVAPKVETPKAESPKVETPKANENAYLWGTKEEVVDEGVVTDDESEEAMVQAGWDVIEAASIEAKAMMAHPHPCREAGTVMGYKLTNGRFVLEPGDVDQAYAKLIAYVGSVFGKWVGMGGGLKKGVVSAKALHRYCMTPTATHTIVQAARKWHEQWVEKWVKTRDAMDSLPPTEQARVADKLTKDAEKHDRDLINATVALGKCDHIRIASLVELLARSGATTCPFRNGGGAVLDRTLDGIVLRVVAGELSGKDMLEMQVSVTNLSNT